MVSSVAFLTTWQTPKAARRLENRVAGFTLYFLSPIVTPWSKKKSLSNLALSAGRM